MLLRQSETNRLTLLSSIWASCEKKRFNVTLQGYVNFNTNLWPLKARLIENTRVIRVSSFHATPQSKLQIADRNLNDFGNESSVKRVKPKTLMISKQLSLLPHIFDVVIKYLL